MSFTRKLPIPQQIKKEYPLTDDLLKIKEERDGCGFPPPFFQDLLSHNEATTIETYCTVPFPHQQKKNLNYMNH